MKIPCVILGELFNFVDDFAKYIPFFNVGYYTYLYAKCFAATIWKNLCHDDPLSSTTGTALRTKFLQHGGAREPAAILNDLVGDKIYRHCDGGIVPDIASLSEELALGGEYQ